MNPNAFPSRRTVFNTVASVALAGIATAGSAAGAPAGDAPENPATVFPAGTHAIDHDRTIRGDMTIAPGALLVVANGATLTLLGDLIAPSTRVFAGEGRVDLTRSRLIWARPEWWGAVADDPATDSLPALTACTAAHLAVQLGLGDYYIGATWRIADPNRRIWGIGRTYGARGTRLVRSGGKGDVVLVGTERAPPAINDYLRGIDLRGIELGRSRAAVPPNGDDASAAAGLRIRHVLDCHFEGLRANEHAIGYSIRGAVRSYLHDCTAFRSIADDPQGRDIFVGFDMDGRDPPIATGANASLYLIDCNARIGAQPRLAVSAGCRMTGAMSDTILVRFETTALANGIAIDGRAAAMTSAQRRAGHVNVHIDSAILDGCTAAGIVLRDLSEHALIDVRAPYVALGPGGTQAIAIERCGGNIGVSDGQLIGWPAAGATGITLRTAAGVSFTGTKLLGFAQAAALTDTTNFELIVAINQREDRSGRPAIAIDRCDGGYVRPRIAGIANAHSAGIAIDAQSRSLQIDPVGIDPRACSGVAITVAGMPITASRPGVVTLSGPVRTA